MGRTRREGRGWGGGGGGGGAQVDSAAVPKSSDRVHMRGTDGYRRG